MIRQLLLTAAIGGSSLFHAQSISSAGTGQRAIESPTIRLTIALIDASDLPILGYAVEQGVLPFVVSVRLLEQANGQEVDARAGTKSGTYVLDLKPARYLVHTQPAVCGAQPIEMDVTSERSELSIRYRPPSPAATDATAPGVVKNVIDVFNTIVPNNISANGFVTPVSLGGSLSVGRAVLDTSKLKSMPGGIEADNVDVTCIPLADLRVAPSRH